MQTFSLLERIRTSAPMVHHITNWVTIYDCAQICKSLGASPVMAHAPQEAADMAALASALVLNIGTLTEDSVAAMLLAGKAANDKDIPVVLDICGAGATTFRDQTCTRLMETLRIDILKGNASEIARIAGLDVRTKGVDSTDVHTDMARLTQKLAIRQHTTVVVTGKSDIITNGKSLLRCDNGDEMMCHIVGTGCMAASVIGCFAAVAENKNYTAAAASALAAYGIAAEIAATRATAPMAFKAALFDALYTLDEATIRKNEKISA